MNKNIVSLSNHAYKLIGYDVDIVPILAGNNNDEYHSSYNDVSMCISTNYVEYKVHEDEIINIIINPEKKQNLMMFYEHLKRVFNISWVACNLTLTAECYDDEFVVYFGIIDDNNMDHALLELLFYSDGVNVIYEFIKYYIETDVELYKYYAIRI